MYLKRDVILERQNQRAGTDRTRRLTAEVSHTHSRRFDSVGEILLRRRTLLPHTPADIFASRPAPRPIENVHSSEIENRLENLNVRFE